jgi:HlyD family secretion protein
MTANVRVEVDRRESAIRLPNAALRFRPPGDGGEPGGAARRGPAPPAASRAPDAGDAPARAGGVGSFQEMRDRLARELELTPEQQARLQPILEAARQSLAAARGQAADERAAQAERRRIRDEIREKVRAILTPEQQTRYDAYLAATADGGAQRAAPARVYVPDAGGQPRAVDIRVGITDGSFSEVVSGDLQPGQEVIVGTLAGGQPRTTRAPRLRL